jgi:hypothetical protein
MHDVQKEKAHAQATDVCLLSAPLSCFIIPCLPPSSLSFCDLPIVL